MLGLISYWPKKSLGEILNAPFLTLFEVKLKAVIIYFLLVAKGLNVLGPQRRVVLKFQQHILCRHFTRVSFY
jgi:hypothetical protein